MIKIESPAFGEADLIPEKYTCEGENMNPPLLIAGVSENVKSMVLIVDDPDAPAGTFTHWILYNIPADTREIEEGNIPEGALEGKNDAGKIGYTGPCPPSGIHHYFFKVWGLDTILNVGSGASREEIEKLINEFAIEEGEIMARYAQHN